MNEEKEDLTNQSELNDAYLNLQDAVRNQSGINEAYFNLQHELLKLLEKVTKEIQRRKADKGRAP